ncbi:MAG: hypothetical protein ACSW8C_04880 [bacterium]
MADIFTMKVVKRMKKFGIIGIAFWVAQSWLLGIPEFHLPVGTPGLNVNAMGQPILVVSNGVQCEDVHIPNTNCHLYFPIDGSQPSTQDAGAWSGARYISQLNDNEVTDWWVRVLGGNEAVRFSRDGGDPYFDPKMGFVGKKLSHIIKVRTEILGTPPDFKRQFWQAFREIARDPVGRVLLYRLLIEIRRRDNGTHEGCCEAGINVADLDDRNDCRSIRILNNRDDGFSFNSGGLIRVDFNPNNGTSVLSLNNVGTITTEEEVRPCDVGLFHEMLHWFHFLRNPDRFDDGDNDDPNAFKYSLRCYYGDQNELGMWGGSMDSEEIANILGTPNHNDVRYQHFIDQNAFLAVPYNEGTLNGDDLSENVYRISRNCHMRFGHCDYRINPVPLPPAMPNRFVLANTLAINCYREIRGILHGVAINWGLISGEAIKP